MSTEKIVEQLLNGVMSCIKKKCRKTKCVVIDVHNETYAGKERTVVTEECSACLKRYVYGMFALPNRTVAKLPKHPLKRLYLM